MVMIVQLNDRMLDVIERSLQQPGTTECDTVHLEIKEQLDDQQLNMTWEPGEDEPDLETALWATFDYANLLRAPTEIGYGSGEELWESLQSNYDFTSNEADELLRLLNKITPPKGDDNDGTTTSE